MIKKMTTILLAALVFQCGAAHAGEVRVLTAGALRSVVVALQPEFEKQSGHTLAIDRDTAGGVAKRIGGNEAFDVAITTPKFIEDLIKDGKLATGSRKDLAKVGMGVAVKEGAKAPDISTVEAFKKALTSAASVAYIDPKSGGTSGIYFDGLLDKLGIAEQVRPKAKLQAGGYVAELVAKGDAELAVHQISEIVPVKGVTLAGPLPAGVQLTTIYTGGIAAAPKDMAAAIALMAYLSGPAAEPFLKTQGMEKP